MWFKQQKHCQILTWLQIESIAEKREAHVYAHVILTTSPNLYLPLSSDANFLMTQVN
jgi:hypothetical protein